MLSRLWFVLVAMTMATGYFMHRAWHVRPSRDFGFVLLGIEATLTLIWIGFAAIALAFGWKLPLRRRSGLLLIAGLAFLITGSIIAIFAHKATAEERRRSKYSVDKDGNRIP